MNKTTLTEKDIELLKKYNTAGPRYTSYPTAPEWRDDFTDEDYSATLKKLGGKAEVDPLSLYLHVPFCQERCLYCGCHVIIDKNRRYVKKYIEYMGKELELFAERLGRKHPVSQLHWGGGTPTFLNESEIEELYGMISRHFTIEPDAEIAIEVDPCVTSKEQLKVLRDLGFNRISMGVQDFNPSVQEAVHRVQDAKLTVDLMDYARSIGFSSVNLDFIYGLPRQTVESFSETVKKIIELSPDRIALFSYARVPWLKPHQKKIMDSELPDVDEKFAIFLEARKLLIEQGGYVAIGMDHFAKPDDEIAMALSNKTLYRNFMGYTVLPTDHFIGFGVSSIGYVVDSYIQNVKTLKEYYGALDAGKLPVDRGMTVSQDDIVRKWVIYSLMCHFELDYSKFQTRFGQSFQDYFPVELPELDGFQKDGLISFEDNRIAVMEKGTLFIRNIAMKFDSYLRNKQQERRFSQTI